MKRITVTAVFSRASVAAVAKKHPESKLPANIRKQLLQRLGVGPIQPVTHSIEEAAGSVLEMIPKRNRTCAWDTNPCGGTLGRRYTAWVFFRDEMFLIT
jgi:hypothetical protein